MYLAIVDQDSNGKLKKYQSYESKDDADAHVVKFGGFVIPDPGSDSEYWILDPFDKSLSINDDLKKKHEEQKKQDDRKTELTEKLTLFKMVKSLSASIKFVHLFTNTITIPEDFEEMFRLDNEIEELRVLNLPKLTYLDYSPISKWKWFVKWTANYPKIYTEGGNKVDKYSEGTMEIIATLKYFNYTITQEGSFIVATHANGWVYRQVTIEGWIFEDSSGDRVWITEVMSVYDVCDFDQ